MESPYKQVWLPKALAEIRASITSERSAFAASASGMTMGGDAMNWHEYIHSDASVLVGKPIIKGTRLSVEFLLGLMAEGWTDVAIPRPVLSPFKPTAPDYFPCLSPDSLKFRVYPHSGQFEHPRNRPYRPILVSIQPSQSGHASRSSPQSRQR